MYSLRQLPTKAPCACLRLTYARLGLKGVPQRNQKGPELFSAVHVLMA